MLNSDLTGYSWSRFFLVKDGSDTFPSILLDGRGAYGPVLKDQGNEAMYFNRVYLKQSFITQFFSKSCTIDFSKFTNSFQKSSSEYLIENSVQAFFFPGNERTEAIVFSF